MTWGWTKGHRLWVLSPDVTLNGTAHGRGNLAPAVWSLGGTQSCRWRPRCEHITLWAHFKATSALVCFQGIFPFFSSSSPYALLLENPELGPSRMRGCPHLFQGWHLKERCFRTGNPHSCLHGGTWPCNITQLPTQGDLAMWHGSTKARVLAHMRRRRAFSAHWRLILSTQFALETK